MKRTMYESNMLVTENKLLINHFCTVVHTAHFYADYTEYSRSLSFFLKRGSLRRCWSKYTQYPRNSVPAIPTAIPSVVRVISIMILKFLTIYSQKYRLAFVTKFRDPPFISKRDECWQHCQSTAFIKKCFTIGFHPKN